MQPRDRLVDVSGKVIITQEGVTRTRVPRLRQISEQVGLSALKMKDAAFSSAYYNDDAEHIEFSRHSTKQARRVGACVLGIMLPISVAAGAVVAKTVAEKSARAASSFVESIVIDPLMDIAKVQVSG